MGSHQWQCVVAICSFYQCAGMQHSSSSSTCAIRKIDNKQLFVSEPPPEWFGNPVNEPKRKGWTNSNWLKSRFHFSFAEYSDPKNQNFGALRVMNDDLVQPARGFGTHGHTDAEICTYVVDGELTHQDSMGTAETLTRGAIQFMSAGTGVQHSEHNLSKEKHLRFIQMWMTPAKRGIKPNYGSHQGTAQERRNKWAHIVSDSRSSAQPKAPVQIYADINMFVTEIDESAALPFSCGSGRQAYILCIEGTVHIRDGGGGSQTLTRHDAATLSISAELTFIGGDSDGAHVLVVEMAAAR